MSSGRRSPGDPLLDAYLNAAEEDAAARLEGVLGGGIDRLVQGIVRSSLRGAATRDAEVADLVHEVLMRLVRKLGELRHGIGEPIENFEAYATRAARHVVYGFLRQRVPERTRLRNKVRYLASRHPAIRLEPHAGERWVVSSARPARLAPVRGAAARFMEAPTAFVEAAGLNTSLPLAALLDGILTRLDEPLDLDALLDALTIVLGLVEPAPAPASIDPTDDPASRIPANAPDPQASLEQREWLATAWKEITELPLRQRAALLLNLRDADGAAVLELLPHSGVVDMAGLAGALGLSLHDLHVLWKDLPLDDNGIAARLGVTRQQVINLRKSARARLGRRLGRTS